MDAPSFTAAGFRSKTPWLILARALLCGIGGLVGCGVASPPVEQLEGDAGRDGPGDVHTEAPLDTGFDAVPTFPAGTWYLVAEGGNRFELTLEQSRAGFSGVIVNAENEAETLSNITWDSTGRWLEFRRNRSDSFDWYRLSIVDGVASGRCARGATLSKPRLTDYTARATGWSPDVIDTDIVPRTWQLVLPGSLRGVLRIDRDASGVMRGRFKVVGNFVAPGLQEELEFDLDDVRWDGARLSFQRTNGTSTEVYAGTVRGRLVFGTSTRNGVASRWSGTRAEVLGFGLGSRLAERPAWQERTRRQLLNLTEGMTLAESAVPAVEVTTEDCVGCPFTDGSYTAERDDDPDAWPPDYRLARLHFSVQPRNRFDPDRPPPPREFFGYLATPASAPPPGGFPVMVVLNGHGGDSKQLMSQGDESFWYGESAARRGMVVLALEFGHRPEWGYGPVHQPAIVGAGYTSSDWEENGERTFTVRRAVDYLKTLPNVRLDQLIIGGLSAGAEIGVITAALDLRFVMVVAASYPPDTYVMDLHGNHACYRWDRADLHEYMNSSDYAALIAPRPLVLETGLQDFTYSSLPTPWADDKQMARRVRAAYGADADNLIHYLTYDAHAFHVGDKNARFPERPRGIAVAAVIEPTSPFDRRWQTSSATTIRSTTLYDLMKGWWRDGP